MDLENLVKAMRDLATRAARMGGSDPNVAAIARSLADLGQMAAAIGERVLDLEEQLRQTEWKSNCSPQATRKRIQVGNLDNSVNGRDLKRLFSPYGTVRVARVAMHFDTGRSTGVGFVEMQSEEESEAAIAALNRQDHCGRNLTVCWSKHRQN